MQQSEKAQRRKDTVIPETVEKIQEISTNEVHIIEPLTLDDIQHTPELDFLTDNLIPRGTHTVFTAPAKTGKTYFCLHYAVCMANGLPFLGMENHLQRNIGYLNFDMDRRGFIDRIKQVIKGIKPNATDDDINETLKRLKVVDLESLRTSHAKLPNFYKSENLSDLQGFIIDNNIEFCIIDTLSRIRSGSKENDNDDMMITLQNMSDFFTQNNCGTFTIHHTGKDGTGTRGASSIIDETDLVLGLRKVDNSNTHLQLFAKEVRYISPFELDAYATFKELSTKEDSEIKIIDSFLLTTLNPDADKSNIVDYLKSIGNVPTSKRNIALNAGGRYETNCKAVETHFAQGILDRTPSGRGKGFLYWLKNSFESMNPY